MTAPALVRRNVAEKGSASAAPRHTWREDLIGWSFAAPFVILFGIFLALPILAAFLMSFTSFGIRDIQNPIGASFVGLDNYARLLSDAKFWKSLGNTAYFVVVGVPLTLALGLSLPTRSAAVSRGSGRPSALAITCQSSRASSPSPSSGGSS
jgi:ABC-type sugar transport system permease subunit